LTGFTIATSIFSLAAGIPIHAQAPISTPVREREAIVTAGHELHIDTGRLAPGRPYVLEVELLSATSHGEDAWIEVAAESSGGVTRHTLSPRQRRLELTFTPSAPRAFELRLTGGGEPGDVFRVAVQWRGLPISRMPGVEFIYSPHQNVRPPGTNATAVVVHATVSRTVESTVNWFLAPDSQVSAHYTVGKDGRIVQMVEDTARGWHAGVSELEGVKGVNDFSVGIEIVNLNDGIDPYTDAQYQSVAAIIRHLREQYYLPDSRIVSHEHIARPVGRKSDPKGFDFQRLFRMLREP